MTSEILPLKEAVFRRLTLVESREEMREVLSKISEALTSKEKKQIGRPVLDCVNDALFPIRPPFRLGLNKKSFEPLSWFVMGPGLHVIAGPSSHGKSLWALEWAKAAAEKEYFVSFLSLEMTTAEVGARLASQYTQVSLNEIMLGEMSDEKKQVIKSRVSEFEFLKNIVVDNFDSLEWSKIESRIHQHLYHHKPKVLILDYLQMLSDSESDDKRLSMQLSNMSRKLKNFADQNEIAIIVLSQMNREALKEVERSKIDGVVYLNSTGIKESNGIVEAADSVQIVCIPQRLKNCPPELFNKIQVRVDKNRGFGQVGFAMLSLNLESGLISS